MSKYSLVHVHYADGSGSTTHMLTSEVLSYRAHRMGRGNVGLDVDERVTSIDSEPLTQAAVSEMFRQGRITAEHAHRLFTAAREV